MKKNLNIKSVCIIIATIMLIMIKTTSLAVDTAKVSVETARLRKTASETSSVIELVSQGEEVEILEKEGNWYKVKYKSYTGYIREDLLDIQNTETETNNENQTNTQTQNNSDEETNSQNENNLETETQANNENETNNTQAEGNLSTNENQNTEENNSNNQVKPEEANNEANSTNTETTSQEETQSNLGQYKTKESITLKILPLVNSLEINKIEANQNLNVEQIINGWAYIIYENNQGWARLDNLEKIDTQVSENEENTSQENEQNKEVPNEENSESEANNNNNNEQTPINMTSTKYVNAQTVNVRSSASTSSDIVTQLKINTEVQVLSEENSWYKIKVNNYEGYVASSLLSDTKQEETSRGMDTIRDFETQNTETENNLNNQKEDTSNQNVQNSNSSNENKENEQTTNTETQANKGAEVLAYAMQFKGSKYVYGGASPSGFDCSGFTYYVYKHFGITLSRTAAGQYSNNGTSVSKKELKPGDLVMFCNPVNHVGIYAGGGKMIHAANPSRGVTMDTINSGYYSVNYRGAKRIF